MKMTVGFWFHCLVSRATSPSSVRRTQDRCCWSTNYLLVNRPQITQNALMMKRYSLIFVVILTAVICASSFAQDKASLQSNATVVSLLQGSVGKTVELHLRSGEKMGGKIAQVTDNIVHLSNL